MRYITETKNLFDINKAKVNIQNDGSFVPNVGHTDHFYSMNVKAGETYTVSYYTTSFDSFGQGLNLSIQTGDFYRDGVQLFIKINPKEQYVYQKGTFTIPEGANKITFSAIMASYYYNFMIELGDTATPYVPYGYLPMRRMKYKQNNVCQLLDKSKYPATGTRNGITFTHNGDGSYTANGTFASSDGSYFYFITNEHKNTITLLANHKYLVLNGVYYEAGTYSVWMVVNNQLVAESNGTLFGNDFNAKCYTPKNDEEAALSMRIVHKTNVDTVNFVFKPQLFDLTEMYGAGNEPTTVEEFRADFPDDLYEYTPYCWAYMKNIRYIDTTKNLFDISKVTEIDKLKIIGNSIYSYQYPVNTNDPSTLSIFKSLKPNTNYTMSAITNYLGDSSTHIILVFNNGSIGLLTNYTSGFIHTTFSLTQEQIDNINAVYFYGKPESKGGPVIWSNIQIEEGNTATGYVPYEYLPLK